MALVIETKKYRNKVDKDFIITVLQLDAEDEDYREPAYIWKEYDPNNKVFNQKNLNNTWHVSLDHNFLDTWEEIQDE